MIYTQEQFHKDARIKLPPVHQVHRAFLAEKVIIVIGANSGIGLECARHFARMGAGKLILGCRSIERGNEAMRDIKQSLTSYPNLNIEVKLIDLSSFTSVRRFATETNAENSRLDLLVLNAAMHRLEFEKTEDGWDGQFQVNTVSQSLLAFLLLPKLFATAKDFNTTPRVVVVSSSVHYWTKTDLKAVVEEAKFDVPASHAIGAGGEKLGIHRILERDMAKAGIQEPYYLQKLMNIFFTRAFSSHITSSSHSLSLKLSQIPIVTTLNPGFCISGLRRNIPSHLLERARKNEQEFGRTSEEGSRVVVFAALGPNSSNDDTDGIQSEDDLRGQYLDGTDKMRITEVSDEVLSNEGKQMEDLLWKDLVKILEGLDERIRDITEKYLN